MDAENKAGQHLIVGCNGRVTESEWLIAGTESHSLKIHTSLDDIQRVMLTFYQFTLLYEGRIKASEHFPRYSSASQRKDLDGIIDESVVIARQTLADMKHDLSLLQLD